MALYHGICNNQYRRSAKTPLAPNSQNAFKQSSNSLVLYFLYSFHNKQVILITPVNNKTCVTDNIFINCILKTRCTTPCIIALHYKAIIQSLDNHLLSS